MSNYELLSSSIPSNWILFENKELRKSYEDLLAKEKRLKFLKLSTGAKDSQLKQTSLITLEQFVRLKEVIVKKYPQLAEFDFDKNIAAIEDRNERIDYIADNYYTNQMKNFLIFEEMEIDEGSGRPETILIERPKEVMDQIFKWYEAEKKKEKDLSFSRAGSDLDNVKKLLSNEDDAITSLGSIKPEVIARILTKDQCKSILALPFFRINFIEAYNRNHYNSLEFAMAHSRANLKRDYLTRYSFKYDIEDDIHPLQDSKYKNRVYKSDLNAFRLKFYQSKLSLEYTYQPRLFNRLNRYAQTSDNHRIDAGLILCRLPIFLHIDKTEMDYMFYKNKFNSTYGIQLENSKNDFNSFNMIESPMWKDIETTILECEENSPNLRIKKHKQKLEGPYKERELKTAYINSYNLKDNFVDDPFNVYSSNSKHYLRVDPLVKDPKNIQTHPSCYVYYIAKNKLSGRWEFPTASLNEGVQFRDALENLVLRLSGNNFSAYFPGTPPILQVQREFFTHEKADNYNKKLEGVRTLYFQAFHDRGTAMLLESARHNYTDFALVRKDDMHKYFEEDYYQTVVPTLK
eukprot:CAMPEP_0170517512 /NCGR_PEP_ID=MMETSP0209-20121228/3480_1 /TAXON_ID=665100 ORGANISM="Litonotus pictus, Strain P1" /NCGR_SAMPLE_ID=MMETSP0209 /ASSEMBLY_ACC=CAM_ASM_000301 /LENGTH=572 /DNA_ID=CAMNT_0010802783 /DNA_START=243 /DNA_END=1961 /DNA_ORIENTATION=-